MIVRRTVLEVADDAGFVDDHGPPPEPAGGAVRSERRRVRKSPVFHAHPGQNVGDEGELQIKTLGEMFVCGGIIHAYAQDPGVQALIEI